MCIHPRKEGGVAGAACCLLSIRPTSTERPSFRGLQRCCRAWGGACNCTCVKRHKETPRDGNDNVLLSLCCFLCMLVKTWGQSVCGRPNKSLLIRPGALPSGTRTTLSSSRDAFSPQETCLFKDWPVSLCTNILAFCSDTMCAALPQEGGIIQSCYLLLEGSKLHQVDLDVCFKCHSVLPCNETLHTDFPRLRGIRPSKRRIQSSSLWCIRVRSLKSTIYSNIDISTCQKREGP